MFYFICISSVSAFCRWLHLLTTLLSIYNHWWVSAFVRWTRENGCKKQNTKWPTRWNEMHRRCYINAFYAFYKHTAIKNTKTAEEQWIRATTTTTITAKNQRHAQQIANRFGSCLKELRLSQKFHKWVSASENISALSLTLPLTLSLSLSIHQLMVFECDDEMLLNFVCFNCRNLIFV